MPTKEPDSCTHTRMAVRPATPSDHDTLRGLLADLELEYPGCDLTRFHVGTRDGEIVAIAEFSDAAGVRLLSCVGVREDMQRRGVGRWFVRTLLASVESGTDVYLFTLVPEFFRRIGFVVSAPPPGLVRSEIYGCRDCRPDRCCCLVRRADASGDRSV